MIGDDPEIELPEGWVAEKLRFSGNFKLIVTLSHEETGTEIRIRPYKTYEDPGFPNAHRLILIDPDDGVEEIACGMEIEHVEDAKNIAIEKMKERSQ